MSTKVLSYLMMLMILLQATFVAADSHQFHQSGTFHQLAGADENYKNPAIFVDLEKTSSERENLSNLHPCHHCCHCHGSGSGMLLTPPAHISSLTVSSDFPEPLHIVASHLRTPHLRPPIA